ncbi:M23 family metallopeptidase [Hymenobacter busanensis]|uniref:M23 family metallopeptidase n=1 Tax=Hymenobacter busanensis TaxID=2607656 RepID=UPI00136779EB|nr:M23 family metallopeptidase [Hymenobacter busanensis]QHJ06069.1 peptidoglycan DD-metalloendopeptidase family protein [Hymenobacter busanensis]
MKRPLNSWLLAPPALLLLISASLPPACSTDTGKTDKPAAAKAKPAQTPADSSLRGYFQFPIKPGQPNLLAASMGELRPNHFHGGLDIKTDGGVDRPVYAAAEGYISRLKQSSFGYGNVLYITHPNGLTTVYGHLNHFRGPVAAELLKRQYEKQTYELELHFQPGQFPVQKGEVVALSGNTGGSAGPHLHWEVRDAKDNQLNPLQWGGFAEIQDHVPPTALMTAVEPLSIDARVQGRFEKRLFAPTGTPATGFVVPDTIPAYGTVGLLLQAFDRFDNAWNKNGLQRVEVLVNGKPWHEHFINGIGFPDDTRQVNHFTDYDYTMSAGRTLQKLWIDDGNTLPIYRTGPLRGKLRVEPGQVYTVEIRMADSYGNTTPLRMVLRGEQPAYWQTRSATVRKPTLRYDVLRNILRVTVDDTARQAPNLTLLRTGRQLQLKASYTDQSRTVYLYDLRAGLPDSLRFPGIRTAQRFDRQAMIPAGTEQLFANQYLSLAFAPRSIYDTLYLQTSYKDGLWTIQNARTPVQEALRVTLKPPVPVVDKARSAVYMVRGNAKIWQGNRWDGENITFATRIFGQFRILTDTIPPSARLVSKSAAGLVFKVGDDLSGLASYALTVGGQWRRLRFEHKNSTLFTENQDTLGPRLRGPASLRITDQAGNEKVINFNL